jgi:YbbR domain-containing protein
LTFVGTDPAFDYATTTDRAHIVVGGSTADLDRLTGSTIVGQLDVRELKAGTSDVAVTADLPAGVTLVSADPATVPVTVTAKPTPSPSSAEIPSAVPSVVPAGG